MDEEMSKLQEKIDSYHKQLQEEIDSYRKQIKTYSPQEINFDDKPINKLASALGSQGWGFIMKENLAPKALPVLQESVELFRLLYEQNYQVSTNDFASALGNLSLVHRNLGQIEEALTITKESVKFFDSLYKSYPNDNNANYLAMVLHNLSLMHGELGETKEALIVAKESVELCRLHYKSSPQVFASLLVQALGNLGKSHHSLGQSKEALAVTKESVELSRSLQGR